LFNWRFRDERRVSQPEIVEQNAEWLFPDSSLPDLLMAVKF
jgi:hypothetical protein